MASGPLLLGPAVSAQIPFQAPSIDIVGAPFETFVVADMDGDGLADLVTCHDNPPRVVTHFSDGSFSFEGSARPAVTWPLPFHATTALAEDLTGDGVRDLELLARRDDVVMLLHGNGDGTFGAPQIWPTANQPVRAVVGDFDGDDDLDLVVQSDSGLLAIILSEGGSLVSEQGFVGPGIGQGLAVGDFDGNGNLDVAAESFFGFNPEVMTVYYGDGAGGVSSEWSEELQFPGDLAAGADVNEDGYDDLVLSQIRIGLFLADGQGGFTQMRVSNTRFVREQPVVTDLDGDGHVDAAAVQAGLLVVEYGDGTGGFGRRRELTSFGYGVCSGDINGDGIQDLIAGDIDLESGSIVVHGGAGSGVFAQRQAESLAVFHWPGAFARRDFDEDGLVDIAVGYVDLTRVSVFLAGGESGLVAGPFLDEVVGPGSVLLGEDFDEDTHIDLVSLINLPVPDDRLSWFLKGDGSGGFTRQSVINDTTVSKSAAAGDFDEDGHLDLLVSAGVDIFGRSTYTGNGDGTFGARQRLDLSPFLAGFVAVAAADWDEDGHLDVLSTIAESPARFSVLLGDGTGQFPVEISETVENDPGGLITADFNDDGHVDVAFVHGNSDETGAGVSVILGMGSANIAMPVHYSAGGVARSAIHAADLDADGHLDLAVTSSVSHEVSILRGDGLGNFSLAGRYRMDIVDGLQTAVTSLDLDQNGYPDLIVANHDDSCGPSGCDGVLTILRDRTEVASCMAGVVNAGSGPVADVLRINGSTGTGFDRTVYAPTSTPIQLALDAPPGLPLAGASVRYVLWAWGGQTYNVTNLMAAGESLGCTARPTPFSLSQTPQPRICVRGNGMGRVVCRGVMERSGPAFAPFVVSVSNGFNTPKRFLLQALVEDPGAGNGLGFSVTNGVTLDVN
jgi:hypothetical protein